MDSEAPDEVITVKEACRRYGLSRSTLYVHLAKQRALPEGERSLVTIRYPGRRDTYLVRSKADDYFRRPKR